MLVVYRDVVRDARTADRIDRIRRRIDDGDSVGALIVAGEIEQAILDEADARQDDWADLHVLLRAMVCAAAAVTRGRAPSHTLLSACERATAHRLPVTIAYRAPEGYCHYALDPLAYARTAETYRVAGRHCALVIGVRSIGTSLGAVVADTLHAPSITVRARGPSGSRHIQATPRLRRYALEMLNQGGDAAIVDEGPGATGETFETVARWCREELHLADDRIVLFPSHGGNSPLAPPNRKQWLEAVTKFPPLPEDRGRHAAESAGFYDAVSISRGEWRKYVTGGRSLPAACNFERTKYLAYRDGARWQIRFVGAGEWGDALFYRTRELAERNCVAPAEPLQNGFMAQPWTEGIPLTRRSVQEPDAIDAARHLNARHRLFPTGDPVKRDHFIRVLELHGEEAGISGPAIAAARRKLEALPERESFICDARIAPHEWIRTEDGLRKVDAVDHGDGFRLPGPADSMWDYAGWLVEFGTSPANVRELADRITPTDLIAASAYAPVYAAVAFGDALLSAREAADPRDRRSLLRECHVYRAALRRLVHVQ